MLKMPSLLLVLLASIPSSVANDKSPRISLDMVGLSKGISVLIGDVDAALPVKLARESELIFYVQHADGARVSAIREAAYAAGLLGSRIFVEKGPREKIHLADNLADAVVLFGGNGPSMQEILRVLRPKGKFVGPSQVVVKPSPKGMDEWPHMNHGPDNNPASSDDLARAPYLTQFFAEPYQCSQPAITVSAGGRIFKAFGHVASNSPRYTGTLNKLMAFNAYNGVKLWQRDIPAGILFLRNTLLATEDVVYLADSRSCKKIDAATGRPLGEITLPAGISGGPSWKWLAYENGTLFALLGESEELDPTIYPDRDVPPWGYLDIPIGYRKNVTSGGYPWGQGRTVAAFDTKGNLLWHVSLKSPVDMRGICMKAGRIFYYRNRKALGCLDAKAGRQSWECTDVDLLEKIGDLTKPVFVHLAVNTTAIYMSCSDSAVYFHGPHRRNLLAISAEDGSLLWENAYRTPGKREPNWSWGTAYTLILQGGKLYGVGTEGDLSKILDPRTGALERTFVGRRGCTRPSASVDSIWVPYRSGDNHGDRAYGFGPEGEIARWGPPYVNTLRYDLATQSVQSLQPLRGACQDGITISDGHLYWGPWACECNSILGIACLGPAGDFKFEQQADAKVRLEKGFETSALPAAFPVTSLDWPTYRHDNSRFSATDVSVADRVKPCWTFSGQSGTVMTAPVTIGDLCFFAGDDGVVHAIHSADGTPCWRFYTGGAVRYPPTVSDGRVLVGSSDGSVYAFEPQTGRLIWRFQAAPENRTIPVFGQLISTWPVASGVLADQGVAYAAAGITDYDGVHVYALDAATGAIRWQNNSAGRAHHVNAMGSLLLHEGNLYLATGYGSAVYRAKDGDFVRVISGGRLRRGADQFVTGGTVEAGAHPLYGPEQDLRWASHYLLIARSQDRIVSQHASAASAAGGAKEMVISCRPVDDYNEALPKDTKENLAKRSKPFWEKAVFHKSYALALATNAVLVTGRYNAPSLGEKASLNEKLEYGIKALDLDTGRLLWEHPLPGCPVRWGLAIDRAGRVIVTLRDGRVLCFG